MCAAVETNPRYVPRWNLVLVVILALQVSNNGVLAQYACNVCQNSPSGSRTLQNPSMKFTMENGKTWTCGDLQKMVQDVQPSSGAAEARHCADYQVVAELHKCTCNGPAVQSLLNGPFKNVNPACQLCSGGDLSYVPGYLLDQTVQIPNWGVLNCGGLYDAALTGNVLNANSCAQVTPYFREACCKLPNIDRIGYNNDGSNPTSSIPAPAPAPSSSSCAHKSCSSNKDCCNGFTCRRRTSTGGAVCSKENVERERVSDGVGGSRGGSRHLRKISLKH